MKDQEEKIEEKFELFLDINFFVTIINCVFFFGRLYGVFDFEASYIWICVIVYVIQVLIMLMGVGIREKKLKEINDKKEK